MRIIFFGTPDFADASLQALLRAGHDVVGVVTQPDRPQGRSRSALVPPPVKVSALDARVPVLQPERPVGDLFVAALRRLEPDLGVVVAYGHILRPEVLALPRLGLVNVHASLLPKLRGAAPIQWAIANGDAETGVSIMRMDAGMDAGPVYLRVPTPITADDTGGSLTARLAELGTQALLETLNDLVRGKAVPEPQDAALATFAPKVTRETARVDWTQDAAAVARRIRAFDPAPGAWTTLDGTDMKLFGARTTPASGVPGTVLDAGERLVIAAASGAVDITEVQPAGRRRMPVAQWARGRGVEPGRRLA
ncbi:MAG TPA: methionyl-tRNA formyltransferase [Gemmatimonadales bacterium]|jgi:methionyl-tRNA formyltransferase|nr:methionyl-tRNA formyltransferase [Gemmatimonadales bacterium]